MFGQAPKAAPKEPTPKDPKVAPKEAGKSPSGAKVGGGPVVVSRGLTRFDTDTFWAYTVAQDHAELLV